MLGPNGSGKTTTSAKLAWKLKEDGKTVTLAACDTFRAAAVEQLKAWASRLEVEIVASHTGADSAGADSAGVDAGSSDCARATAGMMAADTVMAGRLGPVDLDAVAMGANYFYLFYDLILKKLGYFFLSHPFICFLFSFSC